MVGCGQSKKGGGEGAERRPPPPPLPSLSFTIGMVWHTEEQLPNQAFNALLINFLLSSDAEI